jgi:hypothetical protein
VSGVRHIQDRPARHGNKSRVSDREADAAAGAHVRRLGAGDHGERPRRHTVESRHAGTSGQQARRVRSGQEEDEVIAERGRPVIRLGENLAPATRPSVAAAAGRHRPGSADAESPTAPGAPLERPATCPGLGSGPGSAGLVNGAAVAAQGGTGSQVSRWGLPCAPDVVISDGGRPRNEGVDPRRRRDDTAIARSRCVCSGRGRNPQRAGLCTDTGHPEVRRAGPPSSRQRTRPTLHRRPALADPDRSPTGAPRACPRSGCWSRRSPRAAGRPRWSRSSP